MDGSRKLIRRKREIRKSDRRERGEREGVILQRMREKGGE